MTDTALVAAKMAAVNTALRAVIGPITYMGMSVGGLVTDEEYNDLTIAVVNAVDDAEAAYAAQAAPKTA